MKCSVYFGQEVITICTIRHYSRLFILFAIRYSRLFAIRYSGFPDTHFKLQYIHRNLAQLTPNPNHTPEMMHSFA